MCKSVQEIRSYHANEILHCDLENRSKVGHGHSSSNSSKAMVGCMTGSNCVYISA